MNPMIRTALMLMFTASIGGAQAAGQPPNPPPASPQPPAGDVVIEGLSVPPGVRLTPEMRRRIEAAVRARDLSNAPHAAWAEPRTIDVRSHPDGIRLGPGAILASRTMALETLQLVTDHRFEVGAMHALVPAATPFMVLETAEGRVHCIDRGGRPFAIVHDRQGHDYASICLFDADGDGRFEIVRFLPLQPDAAAIRDFPVEPPVALMPAPSAGQPRYPSVVQDRRLRVSSLGTAGATILLETVPRGIPGDFPPSATAILPLALGAEVALGGVTIRAQPDGHDWRASTSGEIPAWSWADEARAARSPNP